MMQKNANTSPLAGIGSTLAAGFDLAARHWWLALVPLLLDLFLWLGPRLSVAPLLREAAALWPAELEVEGGIEVMVEQIAVLADRVNLFTTLSVPFVGAPVLMQGMTPETTPVTPPVMTVSGAGAAFVLFLLFSVMGLLLTAVYYNLIADAVRGNAPVWGDLSRRVMRSWGLLLAWALLFFFCALLIYITLLPVIFLMALFVPGLAALAVFVWPLLLTWLLIFWFFVPQGLVLHGRSLQSALVESVRLVRTNVTGTLGFILTIVIITYIVNQLSLLADYGSWLTLGSLAGHAFVGTALVAASFIYYRDRYAELFKQD